MTSLMYCGKCTKWVVFGEVNSQRYNETAYIIGGVTVTKHCPKCRGPLSEKKQ